MTWKLVLFDFDGVLCDSREMAIRYVDDLRRDKRFASLPSPSDVGHFGELYRGELRSALDRFGLDVADSREFFDRHATAMRSRTSELGLFDDVVEGLALLPPDTYAIITSAYSDGVRQILTRHGLDSEAVEIIGHEVRQTKTEKAQTLLHGKGLRVEEAVYVGDMESDIHYCRAIELRCVAVTYGYHPRTVLAAANPYAIVDRPDDLFALLGEGLVT